MAFKIFNLIYKVVKDSFGITNILKVYFTAANCIVI